ncbi:MAG: tetratricopeptide repeat protein, partial [Bacteroidota bacterium]|nr:tetratricopeptide repeat protein [Bacteroidota bacterium]
MTKKLIYTAVLLMFCVNLSSAQNNVDFKKKNFKNDIAGFEKAKNHIQNGDIYYKIGTGAYKIAVLFYEKAQEFNPNNDELNLKIGICYLHTDQKDKAKDYILKSIKLQKKKKSYAQYYLGNSLQYESKFEEAINSYNKFLDNMPLYKRKKCKRMALKRISECESGQILLKEKLNIDIHNPGAELNSENSEYLPQLSFAEDTLYFTSRRKSGNTETASIDPGDFLWFEDVYTAIYKDSSYVVKNQGELYNRPFHDALLFKSDKYKIIYRSGKNGDLYLQTKNADGIYSIEKFPETINSKYKESSAVLSPDGNTLYFVSNRTKKSFGGSDIYYSRKDDEGKWEKP